MVERLLRFCGYVGRLTDDKVAKKTDDNVDEGMKGEERTMQKVINGELTNVIFMHKS